MQTLNRFCIALLSTYILFYHLTIVLFLLINSIYRFYSGQSNTNTGCDNGCNNRFHYTVKCNNSHDNIYHSLSCNDVLLVYHTYSKSGEVILILWHKSRMLCCLSAYKSTSRLLTSLSHTAYDCSNFLRIILATSYIIKEK